MFFSMKSRSGNQKQAQHANLKYISGGQQITHDRLMLDPELGEFDLFLVNKKVGGLFVITMFYCIQKLILTKIAIPRDIVF